MMFTLLVATGVVLRADHDIPVSSFDFQCQIFQVWRRMTLCTSKVRLEYCFELIIQWINQLRTIRALVHLMYACFRYALS